MPYAPEPHLPPRLGQLLRLGRRDCRLSLREVAEQLARRGEAIPPSTLSRIERGKLDPSVRRLFLLLELYSLPAGAVAELIQNDGRTRKRDDA